MLSLEYSELTLKKTFILMPFFKPERLTMFLQVHEHNANSNRHTHTQKPMFSNFD